MAHIPRLYWPEQLEVGQQLEIAGDRAHHLLRVLKRREGDPVILFGPPDYESVGQICSAGKQQLLVLVQQVQRVRRESPLHCVLVQGLSRGDRMDYSVQKAVELGVFAIQPVLTQRSGVQLGGDRLARKQAHWQAIALSAAEQSGRTCVPQVRPCLRLDQFLSEQSSPGFVLAPDGPDDWGTAPPVNEEINLLVGPEGGLSADELDLAQRCGLRPLRLGPRILRTETAGAVALTAMQCHWGDF